MKALKIFFIVFRTVMVLAFIIAAISGTQAQTYWTGTNMLFFHPSSGAGDPLTSIVIIDRGGSMGLYNAACQTSPSGTNLLAGTLWAVGTLAEYTNGTTLIWEGCPLEAHHSPSGFINTTFVVRLITNNIYLQLTLTNWGGEGGAPGQQTFGYMRSTPPAVVTPPTPTISITNPANGAVFAAPASEKIMANAAVSSGSVTNVQFFTNNVSFGNVTTPPFTLTANNLAAGAYSLTAAATAAGISATSTPVNISVVTPVAVTLTNSKTLLRTNFQFSYAANVGLSYVIEKNTNLVFGSWTPIATNVAASNPTNFVDNHATNSPAFYRVGRLPNP